MNQIELTFEGGLTDQFPTFRQLLADVVSTSVSRQKSLAADLDFSPSKLSRCVNAGGDLSFPADKIDELIAYSDDKRPIYWLIEKLLEDPEKRRDAAVERLSALLPELTQLLRAAKT